MLAIHTLLSRLALEDVLGKFTTLDTARKNHWQLQDRSPVLPRRSPPKRQALVVSKPKVLSR